jgi:hypothetical protein
VRRGHGVGAVPDVQQHLARLAAVQRHHLAADVHQAAPAAPRRPQLLQGVQEVHQACGGGRGGRRRRHRARKATPEHGCRARPASSAASSVMHSSCASAPPPPPLYSATGQHSASDAARSRRQAARHAPCGRAGRTLHRLWPDPAQQLPELRQLLRVLLAVREGGGGALVGHQTCRRAGLVHAHGALPAHVAHQLRLAVERAHVDPGGAAGGGGAAAVLGGSTPGGRGWGGGASSRRGTAASGVRGPGAGCSGWGSARLCRRMMWPALSVLGSRWRWRAKSRSSTPCWGVCAAQFQAAPGPQMEGSLSLMLHTMSAPRWRRREGSAGPGPGPWRQGTPGEGGLG